MLSQFSDADTAYTIEAKKQLRRASLETRRANRIKRMESFRINRDIDDDEEDGDTKADPDGDKVPDGKDAGDKGSGGDEKDEKSK
jgi:hypothetical protein